MPETNNDAEAAKIASRKLATFLIASVMKAFAPPTSDEAKDNERIFFSAETFVAEAEKRYGLPLPD